MPRSAWLAALVALPVIGLAGCGGSSDESGGTTTEAATTAPATTAAAGGNERLSQASWDEYVHARDEAQQVNQKAIKTFAKCRDLIVRNMQSQQIQQCFGTTTSDVVAAGQKFLATLSGFDDEVGGACKKALTNGEGYVKLYVSSVNALATSESSTPNQTQVDAAQSALKDARAAGVAFAAACKPA